MYRMQVRPPSWSLAEKVVVALAGIGWLYVFLYDSPTVALFYSGLFVFSVVLRAIVGMRMWISFQEPAKVMMYGIVCLMTLLITNSIIYGMTGSFATTLTTSGTATTIVSIFEASVVAPLLRCIFIAVAEEETFRGIVLDLVVETPRRFDEYLVLFLVSGVGFSAAHARAWYGVSRMSDLLAVVPANPAPFMVGVIGGVVLGLVSLKARNLAPAILAHAAYDFLAFTHA